MPSDEDIGNGHRTIYQHIQRCHQQEDIAAPVVTEQMEYQANKRRERTMNGAMPICAMRVMIQHASGTMLLDVVITHSDCLLMANGLRRFSSRSHLSECYGTASLRRTPLRDCYERHTNSLFECTVRVSPGITKISKVRVVVC